LFWFDFVPERIEFRHLCYLFLHLVIFAAFLKNMSMKMTKVFTGLLFVIMILAISCNKDEDSGDNQQLIEQQQIEQYADANQLNGQFTGSGLYYVIENAGSDNKPNVNSLITVSYRGYYLDGTILDEGAFYTERLFRLIAGWQEGIPLIGEGGKIKLIIPSHLAYRNGVLVFDVTLHSISR
jgi:FKBP-type peptidyl-prolyl cis-trans isomerase